ncbi:glycosyltransferase [uncultured Draconibacterium sp.]|uniref:glycosyltransferase n=1 Tax=uncultured Draconibacterium sp. TaxID=1573823 RepID=UPI003217FF2E
MKIVFDPPFSKSNEYSNLITSYLIEKGYTIYSFDEIFESRNKFFSVKVVHLNWFEVIGSYYGFIKKLVRIFLLLVFRKKIIWTMHNKSPHTKKLLMLQKVLYLLIAKISHRIVIHSKVSEKILVQGCKIRKEKIEYIPHPHYIGVYGNLQSNNKICSSKLKLLFFGAVRPYKNIELLLKVANEFQDEIELYIAGKPESNEYKRQIEELAEEKSNVNLELDYIDNKRLISLLSEYELAVLPYDIRSSLNSGSIILCFSYAKSVIVPVIGTINDIPDKSYLLSYEYGDEKEHYNKLVEKISEAIEMKKKDHDVFKKWGEEMFEYVKENNGTQNSQERFKQLYESILN